MHTDWSQFFGRFHPLFVHLPIGFVLLAALLKIAAAYKKIKDPDTAINIALVAAAVSAALASFTGYLLSTAGGYDPATLSLHKWIGFTVTILLFGVWWLRMYQKAGKRIIKIPVGNWLLIICIVLVTVGGHLGGSMTHGEGYLTRYMPGFLQPVFGSAKKHGKEKTLPVLDSVNVFADIIQPVFDKNCVSCHNTKKNKGELDLSSIEGLLKGGKSGNTVVAGNIEKSELFQRITLPRQSSKFMPSENRTPLSPVEINFIKEWIENGADCKHNITAVGVDEKHKYLIAAYLGIDATDNKDIHLPAVGAADSNVLKQLKDLNVMIKPLTSKSNWLEASLVMVQKRSPGEISSILQLLSGVKRQLYRLDVSNCGLTREQVDIIATFNSMNKLDIRKNNLTDAAIESLGVLSQLEILNASQNAITDHSLTTINKMSRLKKINLWQTQVTEKGASAIQSAINGVLVER